MIRFKDLSEALKNREEPKTGSRNNPVNKNFPYQRPPAQYDVVDAMAKVANKQDPDADFDKNLQPGVVDTQNARNTKQTSKIKQTDASDDIGDREKSPRQGNSPTVSFNTFTGKGPTSQSVTNANRAGVQNGDKKIVRTSPSSVKSGFNEEAEELDELSSKTLKRYISAASRQAADKSLEAGEKYERAEHQFKKGLGATSDNTANRASTLVKKANKRLHGVHKALTKLEEATVYDCVKKISESNKAETVLFADGEKAVINPAMANKLLKIESHLSKGNQSAFRAKMNHSVMSLMDLLSVGGK